LVLYLIAKKNHYYNLCYPVKLPFYLTAGISFLSTPTLEAIKINEVLNNGFVMEIDRWSSFIRNVRKEDLLEIREKDLSIKDQYSHEFVISNFKFNNCMLD